MIVYMATNKVNGKKYIGQTCNTLEQRMYEHWSVRTGKGYFQNALQKYGLEGFVCKIIDTAEDREQLNLKEEFWINFFNTLAPRGYNLRTGGNAWNLTPQAKENMRLSKLNMPEERRTPWREKLRGYQLGKEPWNKNKTGIYSEETRYKMGASTRGKVSTTTGYIYAELFLPHVHEKPPLKRTEEHKQKLREANLGRKHTEETKEKCRAAARLRKTIVVPCGWNKGISPSPEQIEKQKATYKKNGYRHSEEARSKISAAHLGKKCAPETREKLRIAATKQHARKKLGEEGEVVGDVCPLL